LVGPDAFIPFAEETGLIIPLGRWVLGEACRQVRRWEADTGHSLTVSVNLSPNQLHDEEFTGQVAEILQLHRLEPARLVLEITETVLMQTPVEVLEGIKALGVRLAIDDFGTGYSSLSYLDRLPIEIIKVDRSFVERVASGDPSPLARTVVQLGESLGLQTVVEGIETVEQLDALTALGVRVGQGFYLARPMDAGAFEELLREVGPGEPIVAIAGSASVIQLRPEKSA
jgi:EAL domain-containing protein (putative c-di-GMP-specific phosphodiesterase class I)